MFNDTAITKMIIISVDLLLLPGLGLAMSECKLWWSYARVPI